EARRWCRSAPWALPTSPGRGPRRPDVSAYVLMRAIGNLCILGPGYEREDARAMVARLLAGCRPDA
ncbi:hypothetical protein ACWC5G_33810, partial [Streptomyces sp. NPDC001274]